MGIDQFVPWRGDCCIGIAQLGSSSSAPSFLPEEVQLPAKSVASSDLSMPADMTDKPIVQSLSDCNRKTHCLVKFDVTKDPSGRCRTKKRKCKKCMENKKRRDVSFYCISCGETFSFCTNIDGRDCFKEHVNEIKRTTRHTL